MADPQRVELTWTNGLQFVARVNTSGVTMVMDGAPDEGGQGGAVRPTEALLLALAGCTAMDVISVLRKKRQRVTDFRVNVCGTRADEHPRRFTEIVVEYVVRGHDVSPQAVERSIELSETKYCSVAATLNAAISHTYRIEQEPTEE